MRTHVLIAAAFMASMPAGLAESTPPLWLTSSGQQPPRLYLFWQSGWTPLRSRKHIDLVRPNPPDLFQYVESSGLNTGVPHKSMCPAPASHEIRWHYEKDKPGKKPQTEFKPRWFTTEEYAARIAGGAKDVKWVMDETGAYGIAPYICASKLEGEREKRLRFWAFYDHWPLYEQWYGPKPAADPWEWVRFRPDYKLKHMWAFYKPQTDGSRIYSACPHSPFTEYLANLVKIGANNGLKGVFVDNPGCLCVCKYCQPEWQKYLRRRFSPAEMKRYFGIDRYEDAKLASKPFDVESKRFWAYSAGKLLAALREAGESVRGKGNFWICPNGSPIEFVPSNTGCGLIEWAEQGAFQVGVRENNRMIEGQERTRLTPTLYFNADDDLILGHKMLRGLRSSQAWAAPLRSHVLQGNDDNFYNLSAAETLAFDGVLCDCGAPWYPTRARKPFYDFYRAHESLLRSGDSVAEVGVVVAFNELYRDPADSVRELRLVTDWLSEARVLWDAIPHDGWSPDALSKYRVVFVPNVRMLDDAEVETFLQFAKQGGALVLSGDVGVAYRCGAARVESAFAEQLPARTRDAGSAVASLGKGKIAHCPRGFADVDLPDGYQGTDVRCSQPARALIRESNRRAFLDCLNAVAGSGLSAIDSPGPRAVRIAARWWREDGNRAAMAVHLANYDLEMHTAARKYYRVVRAPSTLRPAKDVSVAVPVPRGYRAVGVEWCELPEQKTKPLRSVALQDGVQFTVPRVGSYSFAVVRLLAGRERDGSTLARVRGPRTSAAGALPAIESTGEPGRDVTYAAAAPAELDQVLHVAPGTPVVVSGQAGRALEVRIDRPGQPSPDPIIWVPLRSFDVSAEADRGAARWLRFWLVSPSGGIAASGAVQANRSTLISVPAQETGRYALMTEGGLGSLAVSTNGRALMAVAAPLEFEDPNERVYFRVPRDAKQIQLNCSGLDYKLHMKVLDGAGEVRFERDDFNYHTLAHKITVPPGQAGKVWSLTFTTQTPPSRRSGRRTKIDLMPPLAGFVSPHAGRLAVLE